MIYIYFWGGLFTLSLSESLTLFLIKKLHKIRRSLIMQKSYNKIREKILVHIEGNMEFVQVLSALILL